MKNRSNPTSGYDNPIHAIESVIFQLNKDVFKISLYITDKSFSSFVVKNLLVFHVHPEVKEEVNFETASSECHENYEFPEPGNFRRNIRIQLKNEQNDSAEYEYDYL